MLRDMMPHFQLFQPADVPAAVGLLEQWGSDAWVLAGGYDSLDWFKDRARRPKAVVDLEGIEPLREIREWSAGVQIGAMATLTRVETDPLVAGPFALLSDAAAQVASPQIRHHATLGGNLCQDTRCWYYRAGLSCYRAGGNICYADTPVAMNREHSVFGADRCVAVTPSDTAPALVALDAQMLVLGHQGVRTVPAGEFFMPPATDIRRMTVLKHTELLTMIQIPGTWANARFRFEKVADRNAWDFALVSLATALRMDGDVIADARVVAGAVACVPWRLTAVEDAIRGRRLAPETAEAAAEVAVEGARTLRHNGYKVPLLANLVRRAVRGA